MKVMATGLFDDKRVYFVRQKKIVIKKREKKLHRKSKWSNIKYFLNVYLLIKTTQKCSNFVDPRTTGHSSG